MPIINLATEDELSETVACRLVADFLPDFEIGSLLRRNGSGYLRSRLGNFCQMARREAVLLITDLDDQDCAPQMRAAWLNRQEAPTFLVFRIAVREIESWLIADAEAFSDFFGVRRRIVPRDPDALDDPKRSILQMARSASREIRLEVLATRGAISSQGIGYNRVLGEFVRTSWSPARASEASESLRRAIFRITALQEGRAPTGG